MFGIAGHKIEGGAESGFTEAQLNFLLSLLGHCGQRTETRAPVTIMGQLGKDATGAMLEVGNAPLPGGEANGWAAIFRDKVCFLGEVTFDEPVHGDAGVNYGVATTAGAADATVAHVLGTVGTWLSYVDVNKASDKAGTLSSGTARVYFWRDDTGDANYRVGDIIAYSIDGNGDAIIKTPRIDGHIGQWAERTDISNPAAPIDYTTATGHRGWRVADGAHGTQDRGGKVSIGWKAGGAFATPGTDIAASVTGTISAHAAATGDGTTIATTPASVTTTTISTTAGATINSDGFDITFSTVFRGNTGTGFSPTSYPSLGSMTSTTPHAHAIQKMAIRDAITVSADSHTHNFTQGDVRGALATHTFAGATVQPAGEVVVVLERIN